jgi:hypothetical protein
MCSIYSVSFVTLVEVRYIFHFLFFLNFLEALVMLSETEEHITLKNIRNANKICNSIVLLCLIATSLGPFPMEC